MKRAVSFVLKVIIDVGMEESEDGKSIPNILSFMKKVEHKYDSVYYGFPTRLRKGIIRYNK